MTKDEAIEAMIEGKKVSHRSFTEEEWMRGIGSLYEFEDGCCCCPSEFWLYRTDATWHSGWEVVA